MTETRAIPLSDIDIDLDWNSRSPANVTSFGASDTDEESAGLEGLMDNLRTEGQTTAVDVRPTSDKGFYKFDKTNKPWSLVTGFRRCTALANLYANERLLSELAASGKTVVPNLQNGTVFAVLHGPMSEVDAFWLNAHENVHHTPLSPYDCVFQVKRAVEVFETPVAKLSVKLGKTPQSIARYVRISKLPYEILNHWRTGDTDFEGVRSRRAIPLEEMDDLSKLEEHEWKAEYRNLLLAKEIKMSGPARSPKERSPVDYALFKAQGAGTMLGRLQRNGFLAVHDIRPLFWRDNVRIMTKTESQPFTQADIKRLSDAAFESYKRALDSDVADTAEDVVAPQQDHINGG
jgi:hypothetical protein